MKTIYIKDFISNDKIANEIITDFTTNKYIIKGSTGIGGTSAILNCKKNVVIVSPLQGMIKSKENTSTTSNNFFIYGNSTDTWFDWMTAIKDNTCIINTTPEQIIAVKKNNPEIYNRLIQCDFFIDEFDIIAIAEYRQSLRDFYQIIFREIEGGIIISTATPIYNNLDIPQTILAGMEIIEIKRIDEKEKSITIEPLANYFNFAVEELNKGNKVILFTNDLHHIKNFVMNPDLSGLTQTLVGEKLHTKIAKAKGHSTKKDMENENAIIDAEAQLYIFSTKFLIGFDFPMDASVGIIADQTSTTNNRSLNEIIQAYGRVRKNVNICKLFYRSVGSDANIINLEKEIKKIGFENNDNYLEETQPNIIAIIQHLTYSKMFQAEMKSFGFKLLWNTDVHEAINQRLEFPVKYANLISQDETLLHKQLITVYSSIKGDFDLYNGFGKADLLLYATAYLAKRTGSRYLLDTVADRYVRLLDVAKTFIDVNTTGTAFDGITKNKRSQLEIDIAIRAGANYGDLYKFACAYTIDQTFIKAVHIINHLYAINKVAIGEIDDSTRIVMRGFEIVSETIIEDFKNYITKIMGKPYADIIEDTSLLERTNREITGTGWKAIFNHTNRRIITALDQQITEEIPVDVFTQIFKKADDIKASLLKNKNGIKATISSNQYTINKQIKNHENYILSLLSLLCADHMFGFNITKKDNREFNTITKCTRQLRTYTPYEMYQADISSAFATFVDQMVGSNVAYNVYANIMEKMKVTRSEAKKLYNSALNDASRKRSELFTFFRACGYSQDETGTLLNIVQVDKGAFYRAMTIKEEAAIKRFKNTNELPADAVRCHDALFWLATENKEYLTNLDGIQFDIKKI